MFLPTSRFPFTAELETRWREIAAELERVPHAAFEPWLLEGAYGGGWKVYGLVTRLDDLGPPDSELARMAARHARNAETCPITAAILERIPGLTIGAFSMLEPGAHIYPHSDATDPRVFRCHLGLVVPPGNAIRGEGETRTWEPGRCLVFDGACSHEAANQGDRPRIVLLLDVLADHYPATAAPN